MSYRLLSWLVVGSMAALVALIVVTILGVQSATDATARAACQGARDTRQTIVDMLEFSGSQPLDPNDYTGDLRAFLEKSNERGKRFRDKTIAELSIPPPLCTAVELN